MYVIIFCGALVLLLNSLEVPGFFIHIAYYSRIAGCRCKLFSVTFGNLYGPFSRFFFGVQLCLASKQAVFLRNQRWRFVWIKKKSKISYKIKSVKAYFCSSCFFQLVGSGF